MSDNVDSPERETSDKQQPRRRASWRSVTIPSEHGGWGLTLEPVVLGLLVAPSPSGVAIGVAALVAFVARTPLKTVLVDRRRGRRLHRTVLALRIVSLELVLLVACLAVAALTAAGDFWIPLVLALPLILLELWFDMRSRSRRLVPELAGTVGIASVAAAIVLADGGEWTTAAGMWLVLAARGIASVPFVRVQLQRARKDGVRRWVSDLAQVSAVALVIAGWALDSVPPVSVGILALVALVQIVWLRTSPPKAVVVGVQQTVIGLIVVLVTAFGVLSA